MKGEPSSACSRAVAAAALAACVVAGWGCNLLEGLEAVDSVEEPDAGRGRDLAEMPADEGMMVQEDAARDACVPRTCEGLTTCGVMIDDGCGAMIACAGCSGLERICGADGQAGVCAVPPLVVVASSVAACTDGANFAETCPAPGEAGYGQEATSQLPEPSFRKELDGIVDERTGLLWAASDAMAGELSEAAMRCAALDTPERAWRVPSLLEMTTIVDPGLEGPAGYAILDLDPGQRYFTSDDDIKLVARNGIFQSTTDNIFPVRCVSGALAMPTPRFVRDGQVALDRLTGLEWDSSEAGEFDWLGALEVCESRTTGGFEDWRLPTYKELQTLIIVGDLPPQTDLVTFEGARAAEYWSATPQAPFVADEAYTVSFDNATSSERSMTSTHDVRCVRRWATK